MAFLEIFPKLKSYPREGFYCFGGIWDYYRKSIGGEGYLAQIPETEAFGRSDDGFPINPSPSKTVKSRTALLSSLLQKGTRFDNIKKKTLPHIRCSLNQIITQTFIDDR